jgi:hypothetical protein
MVRECNRGVTPVRASRVCPRDAVAVDVFDQGTVWVVVLEN